MKIITHSQYIKSKICIKCGKEKDVSEFGNQPRNKDGKNKDCKDCRKEYLKKWYLENSNSVLEKQKRYNSENKERVKQVKKKYRDKNKSKLKKKNSEYAKSNRDKINEYYRNKRKNDIYFHISEKVRGRIKKAIKNKNNSSFDILGCDIEFYKQYLEDLFLEGMTWDNRNEWHIDHIRPISSFNLLDENQLLEAFNYKNTQPLWANDNLSKGASYIKHEENNA